MTRKLGTGKAVDGAAARKWAEGIKGQLGAMEARGINARYVPMDRVTIDPANPRELAVEPETVISVGADVPLRREWLGDGQRGWWDEYTVAVREKLDGKAYEDYLGLALLAASIQRHDRLINPVTVWADGSELKLVAGERRYLAHLLLGEDTIAARILDARPDDLEKDTLQWQENNLRLNLTLHERLVNLRRLVTAWEGREGGRLSVGDLAALAGVPRVTAHRYITVLRGAGEDLVAAIKDGRVGSLMRAAEIVAAAAESAGKKGEMKQRPRKTRVIGVGRANDYRPLRMILDAAAAALGTDEVRGRIGELDLDTRTGLADAFNALVDHLDAERPPGRVA